MHNTPLKRTRGAQFFLPVLGVPKDSIVIEALERIDPTGLLAARRYMEWPVGLILEYTLQTTKEIRTFWYE